MISLMKLGNNLHRARLNSVFYLLFVVSPSRKHYIPILNDYSMIFSISNQPTRQRQTDTDQPTDRPNQPIQ